MAFQNVVKKLHFHQQMKLNLLCKTVMNAWDELDSTKLANVYKRWKLVLDLIIEDNGGDRLVEAKRGKLYREPSREAEDLEDEETRRIVDDSEISPEEIELEDLDLLV